MRDAILLDVPCIIKAKKSADGERLVEVEASSEAVDAEGDVILQSALLDSADTFIKTGHLDLDHLSELGDRLGIPNPSSFIVGRPREVKDLGKGRTSVVGEIMRSADGEHDPKKNKYDEFWDSLQSNPPVLWRASIYGFPLDGQVDDCRKAVCESKATRFLVKGLDWRSLAFTRNPVNTDLKGHAKIVSAKAHLDFLMKSRKGYMPAETLGLAISPSHGVAGPVVDSGDAKMPIPTMAPSYMGVPFNLNEAIGQYHTHMSKDCPHTEGANTRVGFKSHFEVCCGASSDHADLLAHALMYHLVTERDRARK